MRHFSFTCLGISYHNTLGRKQMTVQATACGLS
jgi:hypothetical protein